VKKGNGEQRQGKGRRGTCYNGRVISSKWVRRSHFGTLLASDCAKNRGEEGASD